MTDVYAFRKGTPSCPYASDLELPVFFLPGHLALQTSHPWYSYYILHTGGQQVYGIVHVSIEQGVARSPVKSPFGSILFSKKLPAETLHAFVEFVEADLRKHGATEVVFKNPPEGLYPEQIPLLQTVFHQKGYRVANTETGALLRIGQTSLIRRLDDWEKRKFFMSKKTGMDTALMPLTEAERIYRFIEESRREQHRTLSMSYPDLERTIHTFPERFILMGVFLKDEMTAASINIKVTDRMLYNFYGAHDHRYHKVSPIVMLMNGLYRYCQDHQIDVLDLGTSSVSGQPNQSLLEFKKRLSAETTPKLTFSKILHT